MIAELPVFLAGSTPAQIITAIFSGGTFAAVLGFVIKWRGQSLSSEEQIRDHYAGEVARLANRLDDKDEAYRKLEGHLREMLAESDRMHAECLRDRDALNRRVKELEVNVRGLEDNLRQASASKVVALDPPQAPEATKAAKRTLENGAK